MYTKNKSIQERLWIEGESSLKDIIALVKKAELSERCAKITLAQDKKSEEVVAKVNDRKRNKESMDKRDNDFKKEKYHTFATSQKSNMPDRSKNECFHCRSAYHSAKFDGCPAKNAKGLECGTLGHFARVFIKKQMKKVNSKVARIKDVEEECSDDIDKDVNIKLRELDQDPWNDLCVAGVFDGNTSSSLQEEEWIKEYEKDDVWKEVKNKVILGWNDDNKVKSSDI
ncbi:hypothetical protein NDU88_007965 [Pleurodeles waltl]|uniref:Uncharacterized protein n=1 Tax=Pleurodeles waltl TaxID=8319 RepID=A0AAV7NCX0_PLEWA|nr:hypothetical protein NDU88_007965 [Pleurodeles waltl]